MLPSDTICPFCKGADLSDYEVQAFDAVAGAPDVFNVVMCRSCAAAWQYPVVRDALQSTDVFDQAYAEGTGYFDPERRNAVAATQSEFVLSRYRGKRVLDIGCGDGCFARAMAGHGWLATGVDPALPVAAEDGDCPDNLNLIRGSLADLDSAAAFDLATLWDVIEHVENPAGLIQSAVERVAPGGALIVETANFQCAGRIQSGPTWWNYQLDHRWYLAPPQLEQLLLDAGLASPVLADRVLRPWWRGNRRMEAPRWRSLVKAIIRQPFRFKDAMDMHAALRQAHGSWPDWSGIEIMVMAARKLG
jgi:2-polyprenyl-3-methyl-5-hydroxy-6-metoxy-1,4-benzoquinol methylase